MEEIINIATLTIDKTEANKSIVETKQAIFDLQKANSELRKDISKNGDITGEQTKKFVENEQALKKLNAEYKTQSAAINDLTLAELKSNKALTETAKSRDQAITQTKELKIIRGQLNTETVEGAKALELLNNKIDANDKFLKGSASTQEKAATITGNYRQALFGVDEALSKFGINGEQARTVVKGFGEGITGAAQGIADYTAKATQGTRAMLGFKTAQQQAAESQIASTAVTEAQAAATGSLAAGQGAAAVATNVGTLSLRGFAVALAATGIGLIVIAVAALINYLSKLDPVLDAIEQITSGVAAAFDALGRAVANLDFSNLIGGMEDAYTAASALAEAQQTLQDLQSSQEVANAKASQQYDELILKSKNRTLTEKERIAFLNQAQKIEEQNFKQRANLADAELKNAIEGARIKGALSKQELDNLNRNTIAYSNYLLQSGKITQKEYDAIKKAELGKIEIKAESVKRLEKSQNAEDKLADDAAAKEKARRDKAKTDADNAAKKEQERKAKSLSDSKILFESEIHDAEEKLKFYESYYAKLNELEGGSNKIKNARELSSTLLNIAKETLDEEIALQTKKIEADKTLNEQQQADLLANAEFLKAEQTKRINKSLLNEVDKAAALAEIQKAYLEGVVVINQEFADGEKARAEEAKALAKLDFELKLLTLEDQGLRESELKREILAAQYEEDARLRAEALKNEEITQAEALAMRLISDKKYAQATKAIDKDVAATKRAANIGTVKDALAAASSIFGESKALAVASALVNTYQGITAELSTKAVTPYEIGLKVANVAIVAATGFAAVRNILKTNKDSGGGGSSISGGASGGTSAPSAIFENPAKTQTVATVNAPPISDIEPTQQPVLILESLSEAQKNQIVKIKSN